MNNRPAFVCQCVLRYEQPIRFVANYEGDLVVNCGVDHQLVDEWGLVHAGCLVDDDPTVAEVFALEEGWEAERAAPDLPWQIEPAQS